MAHSRAIGIAAPISPFLMLLFLSFLDKYFTRLFEKEREREREGGREKKGG